MGDTVNVWGWQESITVRVVAVGLVAAGPHHLYWISCNPAAGNSVCELADSLVALGPVIWDRFCTARTGHIVTFHPPIKFETGIYFETFAFMTAATLCYV